jgi:secreted trypsin-like serine protease
LIKLSNEVELNEFIQTSCLPNVVTNGQSFPSQYDIDAYLAGWGKLKDEDQTFPSILHNVKIKIFQFDTCFLFSGNETIQLCAGGQEEEIKDSCVGDSGGPIWVKTTDFNGKEKYVVAGIVSYGYAECAVIPG